MNVLSDRRLSRVNELILFLLRGIDNPPDNAVHRLCAEIDWHVFLNRVFSEGVDGVIYYSLTQAKSTVVLPEWVYERLKQSYLRNLGRNLLIAHDLREMTRRIAGKNIPLLLLRGADFIRRVYPSAGMRAMSDLDMVIRKEDFPAVCALFEAAGYAHPAGYPYLFMRNGVYYDLHLDTAGFWRVDAWPRLISIKNPAVWQAAPVIEKSAPSIRSLGIYDAIIACAGHVQEHSFSRLIWLYDICLILRQGGDSFSWDTLLQRAEQYRSVQPLVFALRFLQENRMAAMPPEIAGRVQRYRLGFYAAKSMAMLLSGKRELISGELLYLFSLPSLPERVRCVWRTLFVKKEVFPLAEENITVWHYLRRMSRIAVYSVKKLTAVLWA